MGKAVEGRHNGRHKRGHAGGTDDGRPKRVGVRQQPRAATRWPLNGGALSEPHAPPQPLPPRASETARAAGQRQGKRQRERPRPPTLPTAADGNVATARETTDA